MDSMTDDDASLPIDFNGSTQVPRLMDVDMSTNTSVDETGGVGTGKLHTMKDHEMHMSELKKENFELKLRIYFLEEKLQQSQRDSVDDGFKTNIELKVEIEKLKSELNGKRQLLVKASAAVDSLDRNNQEQINKLKDQYKQELDKMKRHYEARMEEYNKFLNTANDQSDTLKYKLQETERLNRKIREDFSKPGLSVEEATEMQAKLQASLREKDRMIDELKSAVDVRESRVKQQNETDDAVAKEQIKGLKQKIDERDLQVLELKEKLKKAEMSVKELRGELRDNERKLELTSQANNAFGQKLNEKLHLKQAELDDVQEKFRLLHQNLEKAQDIIDEASLKDVEAFEEKSQALKAKDALIAELQGNLKQREMENDHLTRSVGKKDVELQKMNEAKSTREKAEQKIQEKEKELMALTEQLASAKNKLREATDRFEQQLQNINLDHQKQLSAKDQIIHRVTGTLEEKESIIQDLLVTQENLSMSSSLDDITDTKEDLIQKLRDRLKERDAVVETNIEEKFQALHKKEEELQELRTGMRERDRLIENINTAVLQSEDTIKNLQLSLAEKTDLVTKLKLNLKNHQKHYEEANEISLKRSRENEGLVEKLKRNLSNREQQIENLKTVLHRSASKEAQDVDENEPVNELNNRLKEKEQMLSDLLSERSKTIAFNEGNSQKMLNELTEKENLLKEMSEKSEQVCSEKNATIARLRQQVNSSNLEIQALENSKVWTQQEHEILLGKVRQSLSEKDRTIEKLINSGKEKDKVFLKLQECTTNKQTSPVRIEITNLKNTIQDLQNELQEKQDIIERHRNAIHENELLNSDGNEIKTNLQNTIRELQNELQGKEGVIERLQNFIQENEQRISTENLEYTAELELELEQKDSLLKQAAETIEAFQAKLNNFPVLEEMRKNLQQAEQAFNKSEVQRNKLEKDMQNIREQESSKVQSLQNAITLLKKQKDTWLMQDNSTTKHPDDQVKRLEGLLREQIQETSSLNQLLQKERNAYENIVKQTQVDHGANNLTKTDKELEVISKLRRSLEDGIEQNNHLRVQLQDKIAVSSESNHTAETMPQVEEEVKRLRAKLEDSERWNTSLQSRLDALQPRARGVGGSAGNLTLLVGSTDSTSMSDDAEVDSKIGKQLEECKSRLDESQKLNVKLRERLEKMSKKQPEELSGQNRLNEQQKREIALLREELQKANKVCDELRASAKNADAEMSSYKKEHDNEFNSLSRALEDGQKVIATLQRRLDEQKDVRGKQMARDKGSRAETDGAVHEISPESRRQVSQLQRELEEMYRKNEELRRTLSSNMQLNDLNRQLREDLLKSQQKNSSLGKQLEENAKKLQLNAFRNQHKKSPSLREDVVVSGKDGEEKLKGEIQRLMLTLGNVEKENKRLKVLIVEKTQDKSPVTLPLSSATRNAKGLDSTDATSPSSAELQSLRKKLETSDKLNAALTHELEVNKSNTSNAVVSGEPLMEHVEELRKLRSRLEESIKTYDALCVQLEENLSELKEKDDVEDGVKDRTSLAKENDDLHAQFTQFAEKTKKIQTQLEEQRIIGKRDKEQLSLVHNQLMDSNKTNEGLRKELAIYDRVLMLEQTQNNDLDSSRDVPSSGSANNNAIYLLMAEIRSLRKQLEASIQSNDSLRKMLQNQLTSPPQRQSGARSPVGGLGATTSPALSPVSYRSSPVLGGSSLGEKRSEEREVKVVLQSETLEELRQYVNSSFHNSESLLIKMTKLTVEGRDKEGHFDYLKKELENLRSLLFKSNKLLDRLWAEQLSSGPTVADRLTVQNEDLQKEITMLKRRVLSQSKILENTATRLESSSRMRKEVERSLFARLSETRETLGISRKNLQDRVTTRSET